MDTDNLHNTADNLEWATRVEQESHKRFFKHGMENSA